ncbi:hypothetical protein [Thalassotalea aquiviva]|uniref:hypothetical protein n=1 Tax=Thalassotalea aquiviva TaxID=3242415 RepID=UPI00352B490D
MDKEQLIKVAQGHINFTFKSILYSFFLCLLVVGLFAFELSANLTLAVLLCFVALFVSFIYYHFNTRLNAALKLIELSTQND